ncbi:hypothetical protein [Campylobacter suis]|uniref:Uncharacterized protein n=1 Tax=Campylobacter suis TaxID=2790657 RepID=A0ABN7K6K8_9BACT|nr:hypothetical protein [Campylobacter suis]CAD7288107.1 hypothetical protein LMG8286_01141 [Campylobacter suis]
MPKINWNGRECDGWVWDGRELKPKNGATSSNTWIYERNELKPKNGATLSNTWIVQGDKVKPKNGANSSNTYDANGAPLPIIAGKVALRLF